MNYVPATFTLNVSMSTFFAGECGTLPFWSAGVTLPKVTSISDMFIYASSSPTDVTSIKDVINSNYNSECMVGDINVPAGNNIQKVYDIRGPLNCSFQFQAIKIETAPSAFFSFAFSTYTGLACSSPPQCFSSTSVAATNLLLQPVVSCVQPCIPSTDGSTKVCMVELGYVNRFQTGVSSTINANGNTVQYSDMGWKYHPPYSNDNNVLNIMWPDSCYNLQNSAKYSKFRSNGVFQLTDAGGYTCNINDNSYCSLFAYVNAYNLDPVATGGLWANDTFNNLKTYQYWRKVFGWDSVAGQVVAGRSGYVGFRGQPISFAPGKQSSVTVIPILQTDNFCWVLGNSFVDICARLDCRFSYENVGCSHVTSGYSIFTHFWVDRRIASSSDTYDNFMLTTYWTSTYNVNGTWTYNFDNAWRFYYSIQFEGSSSSFTKYGVSQAILPLPSPCMSTPAGVTQMTLQNYDATCNPGAGVPCPGGFCSLTLSTVSPSPLTYAIPPGSGCSTSACATPNNGQYGCPCAYSILGSGTFAVGSCSQLSGLPLSNGAQNYTWAACSAVSFSAADSKTLRQTCGCTSSFALTSCYQPYVGGLVTNGCSSDYSFDCAKGTSISGNNQKQLVKFMWPSSTNKNVGPQCTDSTSGLAGCTTNWYTSQCSSGNYVPMTFTYACVGINNAESTACARYNYANYLSGNANDIRNIITMGNDYFSWKRQSNYGSGTGQLNNDPDADGFYSWTSSYYCALTGLVTNLTSCSISNGCASASYPYPHLYNNWPASATNPSCGCCGNGVCEPTYGEDCQSCPYDCGWTGSFCCGYGGSPTSCNDPVCGSSVSFSPSVFQYTCNPTAVCVTQICYHCQGFRVPLVINSSLPSCESFPAFTTICAFELTSSCSYCTGCAANEICDLTTCQCRSNCTFEVECWDWVKTHSCPQGMTHCDPPEPVFCQITTPSNCDRCYSGDSTCCVPCNYTYSSDLVNTSTTVCRNTGGFPCCSQSNYYPDSTQCNCIACTPSRIGASSLSSKCACNRCNATALFTPFNVTGQACNSYLQMNLNRYNPFGCNCVACQSSTVCPAGQILFPPPSISGCSSATKTAITNWLSSTSTNQACPTCMSCNTLYSQRLLIPNSTQTLCTQQSSSDPCSCAPCPLPFGCGVVFGANPANATVLAKFNANMSYYLNCFVNDTLCDYTAGMARSSSNICSCSACSCPAGYVFSGIGSPCNFSNCYPCAGSCSTCDSYSQTCQVSGGGVVAYCEQSCSCYCNNCTFSSNNYVCPSLYPNATFSQYYWGATTPCNTGCRVCNGTDYCPSKGKAFDTTNFYNCSCVACSETNWLSSPGSKYQPVKCSKNVNSTLSYFLNATNTSCQCDTCKPLSVCPNLCSQKLRQPDLCACVPCTDTVVNCQKSMNYTCPPWSSINTGMNNSWYLANNCSLCVPCPQCLYTGDACTWYGVDQSCNVDKAIATSCPPGQRVIYPNSSKVYPITVNSCPVCGPINTSNYNCPCSKPSGSSRNSQGYYNIYTVKYLNNTCDASCASMTITRPNNYFFASVLLSTNCTVPVVPLPVGMERM